MKLSPEKRLTRREKLRNARLYCITMDPPPGISLKEAVVEACKGGADIIQLRDKNSSAKELVKSARELREVCHQYDKIFIVNDRLDVALAVGADGVHLGQEDLSIQDARSVTESMNSLSPDTSPSNFIIGKSTHSLEQASEAEKEGADYVGCGPIFATPTKAGRPAVGLELIQQYRNNLSIPFVAIGGIDPTNIQSVIQSGASCVAVVRAAFGTEKNRIRSSIFKSSFKLVMKRIRIKVPASTSNLGSGFDVVGLALNLFNEVDLVWDPRAKRNNISVVGEGKNSLPHNEKNIIWKSMEKVWGSKKPKGAAKVKFINRIPLARGLGSSAAARLSGILVANALSQKKLSEKEILSRVVDIEGHPDNVMPSYYGGLCLSTQEGGINHTLRFAPPPGLKAVVCVPEFELETVHARKVLPKKVTHRDAVYNTSRSAVLVASLLGRDYRYLKIGMEDRLHQNYRKRLIPGFDRVLELGYRAGALGVALSGAGPSIFSFVEPRKASGVAKAMERGFKSRRIKAKSLILEFNRKGTQI